jgi:cytochrome P450
MARKTEPVADWTSDFEILDAGYIENPFPIWDDLRDKCPIAHSGRRGSNWMPTRYEDVTAMAHDIKQFSSTEVGVLGADGYAEEGQPVLPLGLPPISVDPPIHTWTRRILLPWFSHTRVDGYETSTREMCARLIETFVSTGHADAASDYAQQIPVRVIGQILGVPEDMSDMFTEWVRGILEFADDKERSDAAAMGLYNYLVEQVAIRRETPGEDMLSEFLHLKIEEAEFDDNVVLGMAALVLIAGVDTTWSSIGSSLWHLATHEEDRHRLATEPELMPLAVEELLRAYAPVTMGRLVTTDVDYNGCPMKAGDKLILNFPAANRDPAMFEDADKVILDRQHNRHVAFGSGIHRCAGSNLARMELRVALEEWLQRIPEFRLAEGAVVAWAGGQVRGPRSLPVVFP